LSGFFDLQKKAKGVQKARVSKPGFKKAKLATLLQRQVAKLVCGLFDR